MKNGKIKLQTCASECLRFGSVHAQSTSTTIQDIQNNGSDRLFDTIVLSAVCVVPNHSKYIKIKSF